MKFTLRGKDAARRRNPNLRKSAGNSIEFPSETIDSDTTLGENIFVSETQSKSLFFIN